METNIHCVEFPYCALMLNCVSETEIGNLTESVEKLEEALLDSKKHSEAEETSSSGSGSFIKSSMTVLR